MSPLHPLSRQLPTSSLDRALSQVRRSPSGKENKKRPLGSRPPKRRLPLVRPHAVRICPSPRSFLRPKQPSRLLRCQERWSETVLKGQRLAKKKRVVKLNGLAETTHRSLSPAQLVPYMPCHRTRADLRAPRTPFSSEAHSLRALNTLTKSRDGQPITMLDSTWTRLVFSANRRSQPLSRPSTWRLSSQPQASP